MQKSLYFLLGAALLALGVVFAIASKIGLGPFDALSANGAELFGLTIGVTMNLHILGLLIITLLIKPSFKYVVGAIFTFSIGIFVDIYNLLFLLPDIGSFDFIYFITALILFPLGVAAMINSTIPIGPVEQLPLLLAEKLNIKYFITKTTMEATYVLTAIIYGLFSGIGVGTVMVGTIIIMLSIGPTISICRKLLPKIKGA